MFNFLRRKPQPVEPTFNEKVIAFWTWFQSVAPRFYDTIEKGKCGNLTDETRDGVHRLLPVGWAYGPGAGGKGHSLTLTGEGYEPMQLLLRHWLSLAPPIPGWTFYASKQPNSIDGRAIEIQAADFAANDVRFTSAIDAEQNKLAITVWHPAFKTFDDEHRLRVTFLFLDEALGEFGTEMWIGHIQTVIDEPANSLPMSDIASIVSATVKEQGWKRCPPGEEWMLLDIPAGANEFERRDLLTTTTCAPKLIRDYLKSKGQLADPLAGTGADFIYVSMIGDYLPDGKLSALRSDVEDALMLALDAAKSGLLIGGGFALTRSCTDLLIYDGARSLAIVQKVLRDMNVPAGTTIEYFAREKKDRRIRL